MPAIANVKDACSNTERCPNVIARFNRCFISVSFKSSVPTLSEYLDCLIAVAITFSGLGVQERSFTEILPSSIKALPSNQL